MPTVFGARRPPTAAALAIAAGVVVLAGCSSVSGDQQVAQRKAQELVSKAAAAGVGANITVDNAENLYGDSAAQICDVFDGDLSSAEALVVTGNPSGRRPKVITTDAAEYGRIVIEVYCPEKLSKYDKTVGDLRLATSD